MWVVMAITSFSLILSSSVNLYSQIRTYQQSLQDDVVIFAEMIGRGALEPMIRDDGFSEEKSLKTLAQWCDQDYTFKRCQNFKYPSGRRESI